MLLAADRLLLARSRRRALPSDHAILAVLAAVSVPTQRPPQGAPLADGLTRNLAQSSQWRRFPTIARQKKLFPERCETYSRVAFYRNTYGHRDQAESARASRVFCSAQKTPSGHHYAVIFYVVFFFAAFNQPASFPIHRVASSSSANIYPSTRRV